MFKVFEESVAQKEKFRVAANKLLNQCFLLKKKEDTRKEYVLSGRIRRCLFRILICWAMI